MSVSNTALFPHPVSNPRQPFCILSCYGGWSASSNGVKWSFPSDFCVQACVVVHCCYYTDARTSLYQVYRSWMRLICILLKCPGVRRKPSRQPSLVHWLRLADKMALACHFASSCLLTFFNTRFLFCRNVQNHKYIHEQTHFKYRLAKLHHKRRAPANLKIRPQEMGLDWPHIEKKPSIFQHQANLNLELTREGKSGPGNSWKRLVETELKEIRTLQTEIEKIITKLAGGNS